jgi:nitroreductase
MAESSGDLFEIIATTRSMRRLKPDPVPPELIRRILEAGTAAPSGSNMQRWRFLVEQPPERRGLYPDAVRLTLARSASTNRYCP